MENHTGKILRAIRKYYGIYQIPFAEIIGVRQATLSRIESGKLELSAHQWVNLVTKYYLDAKCLTSGKIELLEPIKIDVHNDDIYGNFKVPSNYMNLRGSTVRTVYPFIKFMEAKIGITATNEFLKAQGIDPDYFVIQNLPININIIDDIFQHLVKRGLVSIKKYNEILNTVPVSNTHSLFLNGISGSDDPDKSFKKFTRFINQSYEINSKYTFEGSKKCFVKVRDNKHIGEMNLSEEFNKFRPLYNSSHFNKLSPCIFSNKKFEIIGQANGWDHVVAS